MEPQSQSVLCIEDVEAYAVLLKLALLETGHEITFNHVLDGQAALDYLIPGQQDCKPSLVFLDLNIPKIDGIEVLKKIRSSEFYQSLPVIIMSSSTNPMDVEKGYAAGANCFLTKPLGFDELTDMIDKVINFWLYPQKTT